jgi:hypothetical protein
MAMGAIAGCTADQTGTILFQLVNPTQMRCTKAHATDGVGRRPANLIYTNSQTTSTSFSIVLYFLSSVQVFINDKISPSAHWKMLSIALNTHKVSITSHWV